MRARTEHLNRLLSDQVGPLVARAPDGDEAAWNALVDEFGGLVWATTRAHRLNTADAADVFQITWIRLVENLDHIQDPAHVSEWLATTARRESLSLLRRSTRLIARADELPDLPSDASHADERLKAQQDATSTRLPSARPRVSGLRCSEPAREAAPRCAACHSHCASACRNVA
jgi:DNA-directed RNA polymerase specialized sigma24 family protein